MNAQPGAEEVVAATRTWLERAVIGLNLCPFAKTVHLSNRIRYFISDARSSARLLEDLMAELRALDAADPAQCETTLLIHPHVLADFSDYNEFLAQADLQRKVAPQPDRVLNVPGSEQASPAQLSVVRHHLKIR